MPRKGLRELKRSFSIPSKLNPPEKYLSKLLDDNKTESQNFNWQMLTTRPESAPAERIIKSSLRVLKSKKSASATLLQMSKSHSQFVFNMKPVDTAPLADPTMFSNLL
jgi:superfamily I DNA and/or RNA helicase